MPFLVLFAPAPVRAEPAGGKALEWPLSGRIVRGFEQPTGPYGEGGHQGVDIAAGPGETVKAAGDGTVEWVGVLPRGRFITITHASGRRTTYLDLDIVDVSQGAEVRRGQRIGTVAGISDDSSVETHLHFDTYVNGLPVDPRTLVEGSGVGSFVRLCPVERPGGASRGSEVPSGDEQGLWSWIKKGVSWIAGSASAPFRGLVSLIEDGCSSLWDGACAAGRWLARTLDNWWDGYVYKGLSYVARGVKSGFIWVWSNRWVKALVAGFLAAAVLVAVVLAAAIVLSLSTVVAAIAAIAATVCALGFSLFYAATHAANFSFASCFMGSFSAGAIAASLVVSFGSISGAVSAGWAELGVTGVLKGAATSGLFSSMFEAGVSYLLTGQVSWTRVLIAFGAGALAGGVTSVIREGLRSGRLVEILAILEESGGSRLVAFGRSAAVVAQQVTVRLEGFLIVFRDGALTLGTKLAYLGFSGSFSLALNITTCALSGRPVTWSGCLASFFTGVAMGGVSLAFGARGIEGLLSRLEIFKGTIGVRLKGLASRLINKTMSKGIDAGLKKLFERFVGKKEVIE